MIATEKRILAQVLYEIRLLLSGYLGSEIEADINVRAAAHLAYALHNDLLAVLEGGSFDTSDAERRLETIDSIIGTKTDTYVARRLKS
nr:hypothetical protein [Comamonas koreensis]